MRKRLAIIGAGPKAAAIIARAAILRDVLGAEKVPEIKVFDPNGIASTWDGNAAFSSGFLTMCTPGEKDVGFPYDDTTAFDEITEPIAPELFASFSWSAFLVATGRYGDWVDRDRDHPNHALFATYLRWVFAQADHPVIPCRVERVWYTGSKWCVEYFQDGELRQIGVDGVVLTGTGDSRMIDVDPAVPPDRVFTAETFWQNRHLFLTKEKIEVAVAGDGGAAGTITAWLAERFAETSSRIWAISPMGTLFPRGDGHAERRWFSFPQGWPDLSVAHRRKLIERTEVGVISLRNKRLIDRSERIEHKRGKLKSVTWNIDELFLKIEYDGHKTDPLTVHYAINATGFDGWTRLALVDHPAAIPLAVTRTEANARALDSAREAVELKIAGDLSMPVIHGFPPGLHVPALAGLARGPGMGNLACLGFMATKVLQPYIK